MKARMIVAAGVALLGTGCATPARFEWGSYENSLYQYYKKPGTGPQYEEALQKAVAAGEKTQKVAPGLYAELGYLSLERDDVKSAVTWFEKEMALFPESRPFLTRIIAQATAPAVSEASVPTPVS